MTLMRPQGFRLHTATRTLNERRLDTITVLHISPKCDPAAPLASRDYCHLLSRRGYITHVRYGSLSWLLLQLLVGAVRGPGRQTLIPYVPLEAPMSFDLFLVTFR